MPLVRLPGVYREICKRAPHLGRPGLLRKAVATQARAGLYYWRQLLVFAVACFCFASPYLAYFLGNQALMGGHMGDKLIFGHAEELAGKYQIGHAPLYLGLHMPAPGDAFHYGRWP